MTKEKALLMALEIIDQCKTNGDQCLQCPFNFCGCIVGNGGDTPAYWHAREVVAETVKAAKNKR